MRVRTHENWYFGLGLGRPESAALWRSRQKHH
ncbi:hypothetical protein L1277_002184 [Okibacterium sp. HSC-33S16]|nr:hypothetical protein [Okibacterium sp. HSC-33S16]